MLEEKTLEKPIQAKNLWWDLFLTFFKIGAFTIGGGYVMLPLIEKEIVDRKKWMESIQFMDLIAIAQAAPGVLAINTAVSVGYQIAGVPGALIATLGAALPSFMIIMVIAILLLGFQDNTYIVGFFKGVAPAITMLLFIVAFNMGKKTVKDVGGMILLGVGLVGVIWLGVHPIIAILVAGVFGAFYYQ